MVDNKKIFWISSYPKSGNTWMRAILSSLFFTNNGKFNFDLLNFIVNFETSKRFEFIKSLNHKDFTKLNDLKIISKYWIEAQKNIKINEGSFGFFKTHNARVKINNHYYTDASTTLGFIYISRDPRDVVISYSKFSNLDFDIVINLILNGQVTTKQKIDKNYFKLFSNFWKLEFKIKTSGEKKSFSAVCWCWFLFRLWF